MLDIVPPTGPDPFHVGHVACPDQLGQVDEHFATLMDGNRQLAVVWPELMSPPEVRDGILERLSRWPLARASSKPVLVVPGTWHESEGSRLVNRCLVYAGHGNLLLTYDKRKCFGLGGRLEDIVSGQEIPILIVGRRLIGVSICLDFCEGMHERTYSKLAVDLFIVPSLGGASTIGAHCAATHEAYLRHGTSIFVVQQRDEGGTREAAGYVMLGTGAAAASEVGSGICFRTV